MAMITRRQFLKAGTASAAVLYLARLDFARRGLAAPAATGLSDPAL